MLPLLRRSRASRTKKQLIAYREAVLTEQAAKLFFLNYTFRFFLVSSTFYFSSLGSSLLFAPHRRSHVQNMEVCHRTSSAPNSLSMMNNAQSTCLPSVRSRSHYLRFAGLWVRSSPHRCWRNQNEVADTRQRPKLHLNIPWSTLLRPGKGLERSRKP